MDARSTVRNRSEERTIINQQQRFNAIPEYIIGTFFRAVGVKYQAFPLECRLLDKLPRCHFFDAKQEPELV